MRSGQAGFVTLAAIVIMVVVTLVGTLLYTSLLGEVQGEIGARQSVAALGVAEAGVNLAGNKLGGAGAPTYAGDTNQAANTADGTQVGVFDVSVTCLDGSAVSTVCATQGNVRQITSTGYLPTKSLALGKRQIQIVTQETVYQSMNFALCAYQSVTLKPSSTVLGNVGSEGTATPDLTLSPGATVQAGGGLPGSISMVTTANCGTCPGQVAGNVNSNQAAGTVCPNKTNVVNAYTCTPGSTDWLGGNLTINSTNASWRNIVLAGNTVTFDTTGLTAPLVVQVNSITATGPGNAFLIKGGGRVQLIVNGQTLVGPGSVFGRDATTGTPVNANNMLLESCSSINTGPPYDIFFGPSGSISAVFVDPNGFIQMNPSVLFRGSVLAANIQLQPSTGYAYDNSAQNIGFGNGVFTKLVSWQDVP